MARKKLIETAKVTRGQNLSRLGSLVESWGKNKTECDALDKLVKADAAQIKQIMMDEKLDTSISGDYAASLSFKHSESFDEEGLLTFIKSAIWGDKGSMECPYIKRVEVIDWDAVEKGIYNGDITNEQVLEMDKFKSVTDTPVLRLVDPKKLKKED